MNEYEEIQFDKNIVFPDYSDGWLSSSKSSDPNSQLVIRRKADLQVRVIYPFINIFSC